MTEIVLTTEEVNGILTYLNDNPAKFSNPLINFFNGKINEAQQMEQERKLANVSPPEPPTDQEGPKPKKRGVVKRLRNIEVNEPEHVSEGNNLNT
jgi:hypothetical protein